MAKITQTAGRNALGEFAPQFAHFNDDVLFGENWNNEDIDVKTRSIITVVALMAQGITGSSLKFHLQNAKAHGVTQKEIAAIITHVAFYAGWPNGWAVFNLARAICLTKIQRCVRMQRKWYSQLDSQMMHLHSILSDRVIWHRYPPVRLESSMSHLSRAAGTTGISIMQRAVADRFLYS